MHVIAPVNAVNHRQIPESNEPRLFVCLQTVQVDITTAIPISKAVAKLLDNSLSYAVIKEVCTDAPPKEAGIVLELYCAALSLHRACKSVHPDVPQLSGKALFLKVISWSM